MKPTANIAPTLGHPMDAEVAQNASLETVSMIEREERLRRSIEVVTQISHLAGRHIDVTPIESAEAIPAEPGIYILRTHTRNGEEIEDAHFELEATLLSGVADSAHAVVGGDIVIGYKGSDEDQVLRVAAKNFFKRTPEDRFNRATNELRVMEDMEGRGELTYKPIAVALAPKIGSLDHEVVVLTEYDKSILTLDNIAWGRGLGSKSNRHTALMAVRALGHFNADLDYMHGDAKIKNVAQDESGEQFAMIDFETTQRINSTNSDEAATAAYVDLGLMLSSLFDKKLFSRSSLGEVKAFLDELASEYLSSWANHDIDVQSAVLTTVSGLIDTSISYFQDRILQSNAA